MSSEQQQTRLKTEKKMQPARCNKLFPYSSTTYCVVRQKPSISRIASHPEHTAVSLHASYNTIEPKNNTAAITTNP